MATSFINYQIALTAENAEVIDTLNKMLIGDYTRTSTKNTDSGDADIGESTKEKPKDKKKAAGKKKVTVNYDVFKKAAIGSKKDNGEEFTLQVLVDAGVKEGTLPAMCKATDKGLYVEIIASWVAGPSEDSTTETDEDEWDNENDDDDSEVPTVDAVKAAAKAYAKSVGKDEAKEIMAEHGAKALSKIGECSDKQLIGMFAALV